MLIGGRRGRRGTVALEAALALPVLVTLFLGGFDLVSAVTAWRSARAAAISIAEVGTSLAVQDSTGTNSITSTQVWDASTAIFAYLRGLKSSTNTNAYAVTLTAVVFSTVTSCSNGSCVCVTTTLSTGATSSAINGTAGSNATTSTACYKANIAWSAPLTNVPNAPASFSETRGTNGCGTLTPVVAGTASSLTTLPVGMFGPYSLFVADVSYTYKPLFTKFITGSIAFLETAYLSPRIGTISNGVAPYVQYTPTNATVVCSGYS